MAVNKAWLAIAWLLLIAVLPACAGGETDTTTGSTSSSGSSGPGGQDIADGGMDGSDGSAGLCGDGKLAASESCDDGNLEDGDGCSATCTVEMGYNCVGQPAKCSAICGDGLIRGEE